MRCRSIIYRGFCLLLFNLSLAVAAAEPEPKANTWEGLENMMSSQDYQAAGLNKLSSDELSKLNQWLFRFIARDSQQVVRTDEKIKEFQKAPVQRRIVGPFRGWDGHTVFKLDNGEVWKQRLPSRYAVSLENPEVEISKNLLGFYELKIVKTGRRVGVSRIK